MMRAACTSACTDLVASSSVSSQDCGAETSAAGSASTCKSLLINHIGGYSMDGKNVNIGYLSIAPRNKRTESYTFSLSISLVSYKSS